LKPAADPGIKGGFLPLFCEETLFLRGFGCVTAVATAKEEAGKDWELAGFSRREISGRMVMGVGDWEDPYKTCEGYRHPAAGFSAASQSGECDIAFD